MGEFFRAKLHSMTAFPELLSPAEAAKSCLISEERLLKLAKEGFAPCVIIDEDNYLFFRKDILSWARENLMQIQDGKKIEVYLEFLAPSEKAVKEIPKNLIPLESRLQYFPLTYTGTCVYFLVLKDEIVYIGQSESLLNRIAAHRLDKHFDRVFFINIAQDKVLDVEAALIKSFKPKYNRQNPADVHEPYFKDVLAKIGM